MIKTLWFRVLGWTGSIPASSLVVPSASVVVNFSCSLLDDDVQADYYVKHSNRIICVADSNQIKQTLANHLQIPVYLSNCILSKQVFLFLLLSFLFNYIISNIFFFSSLLHHSSCEKNRKKKKIHTLLWRIRSPRIYKRNNFFFSLSFSLFHSEGSRIQKIRPYSPMRR